MEGRCESDCGRDEVYPATFGDEERTGLKLDDDDDLDPYLNHFHRTISKLMSVNLEPIIKAKNDKCNVRSVNF